MSAQVDGGRLIEEAAARFRMVGVIKPRREANRLWAWINRVSPGEAYLTRERPAAEELRHQFERAVERRLSGEPLAHVLGQTGFRHLDLTSDRRALIPRPESESIIELALARVRSGRALDLGTGTGCLALALAQEGNFAEVVAVDLSEEALELAAMNQVRTGLPIRLLRSDLGAGLVGEQFDLIVSNPPYLTEAEYQALDASVKDWEPAQALVSGADGLEATRRILAQGLGLLGPGGWLVMELDSSRAGTVADLARSAGWQEITIHDDLFGRPRILAARREPAA